MRKISRAVSSFLICAMLVGSLAACGKDKSEKKTEATESEAVTEEEKEVGEIGIDPAYIHPGSYNDLEDPFGETSDFWYPEGDVNADKYIMFTQTSHDFSNIGLDIELDTITDKGDYTNLDYGGDVLNGENGHAKIANPIDLNDGNGPVDFDITFQDNFTCYDFVSGTTYKRAHRQWGCKPESWYDDAFKNLVAYREFTGDTQYIIFNEDHTFVEQSIDKYSDEVLEEMTGVWEIKATNVCWLRYDNPEDAGPVAVDVTDSLGASASDAEFVDPTVGVWQQEFDISEDGKVTGFGLFPKYNDDMSEVTGYESAFLLTTKDEMENAKQAEADAEKASEEAAAQAKEDAKNSGSPYEQPEDKKDLSGVNLDQTPDAVIDGTQDYETFDAFRKGYDKDEYKGMIVKLTGTLGTHSTWRDVYVENESGRLNKKITIEIVDGDGATLGEDGATVTVTGVVWNDKRIYTDMAHISVE